MSVTIGDICDRLAALGIAYSTAADRSRMLERPVGWSSFVGRGFAFNVYGDPEPIAQWKDAQDALIVCREELREHLPSGPFLFTPDPRMAFARAATLFCQQPTGGIHPSAVVSPDAVLGDNVCIGPFAHIGACILGDNVIVGSHAFISDHVSMGSNITVQGGARLGEDGLGSVKDAEGRYHPFPHFENLVIGDHTFFGANCVVFRGVLCPTSIEEGTHLSAMSFVGHNVSIGRGVFVGATANIAGSVVIGDASWLSQGCTIRNGLVLPERTTVGMNVALTRSPDRPGQTIVGTPPRCLGSMFGVGGE